MLKARWLFALRAGTIAFAAAGCAHASSPPDTPEVVLASGGAGGDIWQVSGSRRGGRLCAAFRHSTDPMIERCGEEATPLRTWEVTIAAHGSTVLSFAPLPTRAFHVRVDGFDGSVRVLDAQSHVGFPGRYFVAESTADAMPKTVRVFAEDGRAVVPGAG